MDDRNPGAARSVINPSRAANPGATTIKPPSAAPLSKVGEAAQQAGTQVRETAGELVAEAGKKAKGFVGDQIEAGADFLGHIGRSATAAADSLEPDAPQLAGRVRGLGTSVSEFSNKVRGQSPEELLDTASHHVRQNPALVLSAAAICGFALTRLLQGGTWNASRIGGIARPITLASKYDAF